MLGVAVSGTQSKLKFCNLWTCLINFNFSSSYDIWYDFGGKAPVSYQFNHLFSFTFTCFRFQFFYWPCLGVEIRGKLSRKTYKFKVSANFTKRSRINHRESRNFEKIIDHRSQRLFKFLYFNNLALLKNIESFKWAVDASDKKKKKSWSIYFYYLKHDKSFQRIIPGTLEQSLSISNSSYLCCCISSKLLVIWMIRIDFCYLLNDETFLFPWNIIWMTSRFFFFFWTLYSFSFIILPFNKSRSFLNYTWLPLFDYLLNFILSS